MDRTGLVRVAVFVAGLAPALAAQTDSTALLKGTTLVITGSAAVDDLTLTNTAGESADGETGPASVVVTPGKGSTVNGSTDPAPFEGVLKLKINLGDGADVLVFQDFAFGGNPTTLRGGPGDDHVTFQGTTLGPLKFFGDAGHDTFEAHDSTLDVTKVVGSTGVLTMPVTATFFEGLTVSGGSDIDNLNWTDVTVDFELKIKLFAESDTIAFAGINVGTVTSIKLSSGNNVFTDAGGLYGEFVSLVGGSGNDTFTYSDSTIGNTLNVKLGAGINQLSLVADQDSTNVGNDALIKGGPGVDTVQLDDGFKPGGFVQIGNQLVVSLKGGANELDTTGDIGVGEDLRYSGGGQDDVVSLDGTDIGLDANLVLGGGTNDAILNDTLVGADLRITAGSGDDTVQLTGTTFIGGLQLIHLGGGFNQGP